jgi:DHA1 family tetracycline resistance protein-like MFS transporter
MSLKPGASFTTATAYIADISNEENRAKNFGMIGAAFGLGFIIGPALGGLIAGWGTRAPFYAAAILCMLNCLYGYFILPESLSMEHRRAFDWRRANPFGALRFLTKHPEIGGLAICFFLIYMGAQSVQGNWNFFTMYRFNWSEKTVGISLAIVGLLIGLVQAVLTRIINPRLGNEKSVYLTRSSVHFPGVSFLLGSLFTLLSIMIAWMVMKKEKVKNVNIAQF